MSMQNQQRAEVASDAEKGCAHYCAACDGPMRIVMAEAKRRTLNGLQLFNCEYLCDCGYREFFEEAI